MKISRPGNRKPTANYMQPNIGQIMIKEKETNSVQLDRQC